MLPHVRCARPAQNGVTHSDYNPSPYTEKDSPVSVTPLGVIVGSRIAPLSSTKGDQ